jgi:hypothetical protein
MRKLFATTVAVLLIALAVGLAIHGHPVGREVPPLKPFDPLH